MTIDEVHGLPGFLQLEGLWDQVCRDQQQTSFFLSHVWIRSCLAGIAADVEPLILIIREQNTPVAIVPLLRHVDRWRGFPTRVFSLTTNQDAPFGDLILPARHSERALAAVLEHLAHRNGWHVLTADKVRQDSATHTALTRLLTGTRHLKRVAARVPILDLAGGWQRYWSEQSQRFKKTVRNVANRLDRLGTITIIDAAATDRHTCQQTLHSVAARSWKSGLSISVTQSSQIARFFETLTAAALERGLLHLWVLRVDGEPIATEYHVRDGDTVYALRGDFDEKYRDASPGTHLNAHIVRTYFERELRTYDMGPGESEYKQRWATAVHERDQFTLFHNTAYARALYTLEQHAVPRLRRARGWLHGLPSFAVAPQSAHDAEPPR